MTTSRSMFSDTIKTVNAQLHMEGGKDAHLSRTLFRGDSIRDRHERAVIIRGVRAITKNAEYDMCNSPKTNDRLYNELDVKITSEISKMKDELGKRSGGKLRKDMNLFLSQLDNDLRKYNELLSKARSVRSENLYLSHLVRTGAEQVPELEFTSKHFEQLKGYLARFHVDSPLNTKELANVISENEKLLEEIKKQVKQHDKSKGSRENDLGSKKLSVMAR